MHILDLDPYILGGSVRELVIPLIIKSKNTANSVNNDPLKTALSSGVMTGRTLSPLLFSGARPGDGFHCDNPGCVVC